MMYVHGTQIPTVWWCLLPHILQVKQVQSTTSMHCSWRDCGKNAQCWKMTVARIRFTWTTRNAWHLQDKNVSVNNGHRFQC